MTQYDYKIINLEEDNRYNIENFLKLQKDFFYLNQRDRWVNKLFFNLNNNHRFMIKSYKKYFKLDFLNQLFLGLSLAMILSIISIFTYFKFQNYSINLFLIFFYYNSNMTEKRCWHL